MQRYIYTPLGLRQYTRILIVHPNPCFSAPLRCDLVNSGTYHDEWCCDEESYDECNGEEPLYEAISYAWGEPDFSSFIFCGDGDQYLPVTPNVEALLRRLRYHDKPRRVWIDAICINQDDIAERNHQVSLMSDIYEYASSVLVWLGEGHDNGDKVFDFLDLLWRGRSYDERSSSLMDLFCSDPGIIPRFFARQWFYRRWVIQEVSLASNTSQFLCGGAEVDFDFFLSSFIAFHESLNHYTVIDPGVAERLRTISSFRDRHTARNSIGPRTIRRAILTLLDAFHGTKCSDNRDVIYSLIGIASDATARDADSHVRQERGGRRWDDPTFYVSITYHKAPEQVYIEFAREAVTSPADPFRLLQCAGAFRPESLEAHALPSWIPDWRHARRYRPLLSRLAVIRSTIVTIPGASTYHQLVQVSDQGTLGVFAHILSTTIRRKSVRATLIDSSSRLSELIIHWWQFYIAGADQAGQRPLDLERVKKFISILTAGGLGLNNSTQDFRSPAERRRNRETQELAFEYFATMVLHCIRRQEADGDASEALDDGPEPPASPGLSLEAALTELGLEDASGAKQGQLDFRALAKQVRTHQYSWASTLDVGVLCQYLKSVIDIMSGRCLVFTGDGLCGIGPGDTETGDLVALLPRATTPFILRAAKHTIHGRARLRRRAYRIVGDCYIPGIMNGEVLNMPDLQLVSCQIV